MYLNTAERHLNGAEKAGWMLLNQDLTFLPSDGN